MARKMGLLHLALSTKVFYPIEFKNASQLFTPISDIEFYRRFEGSVSCHLWNEVLRSNGVDKNQVFPKESPYERIISSKKLDEGWCLGE